MLVTLVGYEIMSGRALLMPTSASDYAHVIAACLFHDIGYVRGILKGDDADGYVIDSRGRKTTLARGLSESRGVRDAGGISLGGCQPNRVQASFWFA
jgi:hypothetical protein